MPTPRDEPVHPALRYCMRHGIAQVSLADRSGLALQTINGAVRWRTTLGAEAIERLVECTGGEISYAELHEANKRTRALQSGGERAWQRSDGGGSG
jgi:hypothetical protein